MRTAWPDKARRAGFRLGLLIALARAALAAEPVDPGAIVADSNVRVVAEKTENRTTTLFAHLTNCTEATITLTMTLDNVSTSCALPVTADARGRSSFELVTFRQTDPQRSWNYRFDYHWELGRRGNVVTNAFAYHLPYADGKHRVIQADFGGYSHQKGSGYDHAIDFAMPVGTRVCAARDGTVVAFRQDSNVGGGDLKYKNAANYVVIRHDDGTFGGYYHLKHNGVAVSLGQKVKAGETLGFSGSTGHSSGPHLHFDVFQTVDGQTRRTIPIWFETKPGKGEFLKEGRDY